MPAEYPLPAEPNELIGRQDEVARVTELLEGGRLVTLAGTGGIGKSRLALRVAHDLRAGLDGEVAFVELADLGEGEPLVARIAAALGLGQETGRPTTETLVAFLRQRRFLVVMDNCEYQIEQCARWCEQIVADAPQVRVLATSRAPMRVPAETVLRLSPLSTPPPGDERSPDALWSYEAVRLFCARATAARTGFEFGPDNAAPIGAICRALDGLPLGIELAAARVRLLSVGQILERLADRFRLLRQGEYGAPSRHKTLWSAVDWSHELLTEPERTLLRRFSVFVGGATLPMVERVCAGEGIAVNGTAGLIDALVDKSLLGRVEVAGEVRYRMLETVREYAVQRLAAADEQGWVQRRHRDEILGMCEDLAHRALGPNPATWGEVIDILRRFSADRDNIRAAMERSLAWGDIEEGLRLCLSQCEAWIATGDALEGLGWFSRFFAADGTRVDPAVRGSAMARSAGLAFECEEPSRAAELATTGTQLCRATGEHRTVAATLGLLAMLDLRTGDTASAEARTAEAVAIARRERDPWNEGLALTVAAATALHRGRLDESHQRYLAALDLLRGVDNHWGMLRVQLGLASLARARGDAAQARALFERSAELLRGFGARVELSRCLAGIGRIALEQGDVAVARSNLAESLRLAVACGQRLGVARGIEAFALVAHAEGNHEQAIVLAAAADKARAELASVSSSAGRLDSLREAAAAELGGSVVDRLHAMGEGLPVAAAVETALRAWTADAEARVTDEGADPQAGPLTRREREVAVLVARGLTNRGVAEELVISPATVARHVANILGKLGFSSRAQIAAWAVGRQTRRRAG